MQCWHCKNAYSSLTPCIRCLSSSLFPQGYFTISKTPSNTTLCCVPLSSNLSPWFPQWACFYSPWLLLRENSLGFKNYIFVILSYCNKSLPVHFISSSCYVHHVQATGQGYFPRQLHCKSLAMSRESMILEFIHHFFKWTCLNELFEPFQEIEGISVIIQKTKKSTNYCIWLAHVFYNILLLLYRN